MQREGGRVRDDAGEGVPRRLPEAGDEAGAPDRGKNWAGLGEFPFRPVVEEDGRHVPGRSPGGDRGRAGRTRRRLEGSAGVDRAAARRVGPVPPPPPPKNKAASGRRAISSASRSNSRSASGGMSGASRRSAGAGSLNPPGQRAAVGFRQGEGDGEDGLGDRGEGGGRRRSRASGGVAGGRESGIVYPPAAGGRGRARAGGVRYVPRAHAASSADSGGVEGGGAWVQFMNGPR